jgi:hypothetical protein
MTYGNGLKRPAYEAKWFFNLSTHLILRFYCIFENIDARLKIEEATPKGV